MSLFCRTVRNLWIILIYRNVKKSIKILLIMVISGFIFTSCGNKPEVDKTNPFFSEFDTPFGVPPFEKIMAKHYLPAFEKGMSDNREEIEAIIKNKQEATFENTVEALDKAGESLSRVSSVFFAQTAANTNDSLQQIEVEISPKLTGFRDEINMNPELYKRVKYVYDNSSKLNLNQEQNFLLENLYKGFVRNGANLNIQDQDTLKMVNQELSVLTVKFDQNVLNETNSFKLIVEKGNLTGLPESLVASAAEAAKTSGSEGKWAFTTQRPSIFPFLQNSPDRDLRQQLFNAYINRGNNGNEYDNNKLLADIVNLRAKRAKLLGYKTHSDYVLEPVMAKKPENVLNLLNDLWAKAIPVAKKEVGEMQKIIGKEGGNFKLEPSDWWYYAEKLRKQKYDLNDSELRPYFKLENVREGVFTCAAKLFGITFTPISNCPLPHPDAEAYEVKDSVGSHIGVLYMDFHPRETKEQGAWQESYRNHHIRAGQTITPVVTTVFNFTRSAGEVPALLNMDEVSTLFHEFGHALDALFNQNTYNKTFVARDFVELPSQLMEHWATEPDVLNIYARHYETGEPIPANLVQKIKNSGYFNQGFDNVEILAASLLDMAYHTLEAPAVIDIQSFEKEYFDKIGLISEIISRYRSTYFIHITGGYDSGYYSYTWSAVLDNDAFEAFKEKGIFDRSVASSYKRNILEKNGTMDAMEMYVNFRGREPQIGPLLKNRGLISQSN
jgi:peptidyl-dipeptidase Dcp